MSNKPFTHTHNMPALTRYTTLFFLSLSMSMTMAQEAQPQPPVPFPDNAVVPAPEGNADADEKISINLPKATGNEIAQLYRQLTGKRVLVDASAIAVEANIVVFGDLNNKEDAREAFEKAMLMNGFIVVPSGEDEVKIVYMHPVNAPATIGVGSEAPPLVIDEEDIPPGDNVITYIMQLKNLVPDHAKTTIENAVKPLHKYGSITAVPNTSALIITENSSLIKKMIAIQKAIDVAPVSTTEWVEINNAEADSLAETIQKIIQPPQQNQQQYARVTMNYQGRGGGPQPVQAVSTQSNTTSDTPPQVIPEARTNRILILGKSSEVEYIKNLIKDFDRETSSKNIKRLPLHYLTVVDFMPVARDALVDRNPNQQNQQNQQNTQFNNRNTQQNTNTNAQNIGTVPSLLKDPQETGAPESILVGRTLLVADTLTNSIIVQGSPQSIQTIELLLEHLDKRGPQVMISTIFGQFRRTEGKEFGLDWLAQLKKSGNFEWGGSDFNTGGGWNPSAADNDPSVFNGDLNGLSFYGKFAGNINFLLRAAMDTGKFSILSRPAIFAENNKRAVINSGQRVPYPGESYQSYNGNSDGIRTSTAWQEVVLQLEVIALVNSPDEVTLQVAQRNDQITGWQKMGGTDGMNVPTISTQTLLTKVKVPNKGTVVLGGLITKETTKQKNGIPILSDIPLLGWAFSSMENKIEEKEIVIFIQPTIIMGDDEGYSSQVDERSRYNISKDAMEFARPISTNSDEGLLPDYEGDFNNVEPIYTDTSTATPSPQVQQKQDNKAKTQSSEASPSSTPKKRDVPQSVLRPFSPI